MRESERLSEELPSLDMALKFTEHPNVNIRDMKLSVEEWRVDLVALELVAGDRRPADDLSRLCLEPEAYWQQRSRLPWR